MNAQLLMVLFGVAMVVIVIMTVVIVVLGKMACREIDNFQRTTAESMRQIEELTSKIDDLQRGRFSSQSEKSAVDETAKD